MELRWVAYGLIVLIVFLGFSGIYFAIRLWQKPMEKG